MEAVKFTSTRTDRSGSWVGESRTYANTYSNPAVVGQVMSANDPHFSVFWSRGTSRTNPPTGSALWVGKHAGEDSLTTRDDEIIGYIVIEGGEGLLGDRPYLAGMGLDSVGGVGDSPPLQLLAWRLFHGVNCHCRAVGHGWRKWRMGCFIWSRPGFTL